MKFKKIELPEEYKNPLPNYGAIHDIISTATDNLTNQMNEITIEGLKRKGFEFKNNYELGEFIKERCRVEVFGDNRTYYVDDKPFLLHESKPNLSMGEYELDKENYKMTATIGSYAYL
jgi:hypothetical protein|tara:strand:+ start:1056 stop:1409 length:354 start_codon:yes stop_codon:yes gene_type:complete